MYVSPRIAQCPAPLPQSPSNPCVFLGVGLFDFEKIAFLGIFNTYFVVLGMFNQYLMIFGQYFAVVSL